MAECGEQLRLLLDHEAHVVLELEHLGLGLGLGLGLAFGLGLG